MRWVFQKQREIGFIAQDFKTKKIIALLENYRQTTIKKHFYKYSRQAREKGQSRDRGHVWLLQFSDELLRFPIFRLRLNQSLPRLVHSQRLKSFSTVSTSCNTMMTTRITIMKEFDKKSLPYRAMKNHWRILQKDSRKLSDKAFYSLKHAYSNAKLDATNKLIKDIKRQAFGFRKTRTLKIRFSSLWTHKERERISSSLVLSFSSTHYSWQRSRIYPLQRS